MNEEFEEKQFLVVFNHTYRHIGNGIYQSMTEWHCRGFDLCRASTSTEKFLCKVIEKGNPVVFPEFLIPNDVDGNGASGYCIITGRMGRIDRPQVLQEYLDEVNSTFMS